MNVKIRRATVRDINKLISLMAEHALYEGACFDPTGLATRLMSAMQGNNPRLTVFIAEREDSALGYCSLTQEFSSWTANEYMHMDCLFLNNQTRGLGIGRKLFKNAEAHARKLTISELQWQTPDWNEGAVRFYQSLGATSKVKRRFQYNVA